MRTRSPLLLFAILALIATTSTLGFAQVGPFEQTYKVSRADLENALRAAHAYSGAKLPLLDGFVISEASDLDRFQRPYYQFSLHLTSVSPNITKLTVSAKISAYRSGKGANDSGYQAFESNGRLETDLFDRLQATLGAKSSVPENNAPAAPASAQSRSGFDRALKASSNLQTSSIPAPGSEQNRVEELSKEQAALGEILRNQSHPTDLVAVKVVHAPVFSRPVEGSHIVMFADLEDEFQVLDRNAQWVHVKISGISRGWLRLAQVEWMNGDSSGPIVKAGGFQSTREEIARFPGTWAPLNGKNVKIIWLKPNSSNSSSQERLSFGTSLLRNVDTLAGDSAFDGVVIIFDSAEGGMMAATVDSLRQLRAGTLTEEAFLNRCWFDPIEAFRAGKLN